jgi:hypothetical protein
VVHLRAQRRQHLALGAVVDDRLHRPLCLLTLRPAKSSTAAMMTAPATTTTTMTTAMTEATPPITAAKTCRELAR